MDLGLLLLPVFLMLVVGDDDVDDDDDDDDDDDYNYDDDDDDHGCDGEMMLIKMIVKTMRIFFHLSKSLCNMI